MGGINEALGSAGAGATFTVGGKPLTFMPITQGMKGEFVKRLLHRARDTATESELHLHRQARRLRAEIAAAPADEREELARDVAELEASAARQMKMFNDARDAGEYEFDDRLGLAALSTVEGAATIAWLMLRPKQPALTLDDVRELFLEHPKELRDAVREVQRLGKPSSPPAEVAAAGE